MTSGKLVFRQFDLGDTKHFDQLELEVSLSDVEEEASFSEVEEEEGTVGRVPTGVFGDVYGGIGEGMVILSEAAGAVMMSPETAHHDLTGNACSVDRLLGGGLAA